MILGCIALIKVGGGFKKKPFKPWLVWLSGLSASLRTKGLLVRFPVRALAWVVGQAPGGGAHERQPHIDVSLPFSLPSLFSKKVSK